MARILIDFHIEEIPEDLEKDLTRILKSGSDYQNENLVLLNDTNGQDDILRLEIYASDVNDYANTRRILTNTMMHIIGELL